MSDASSNAQYTDASKFFGMQGPSSTGAPGSQVAALSATAPVLAAEVPVSVPGQSTQVPVDRATVTVGDTGAMAWDAPVPASGDPLSGLALSDIAGTGAGAGHSSDAGHPCAAEVGSLSAQIDAARRPS